MSQRSPVARDLACFLQGRDALPELLQTWQRSLGRSPVHYVIVADRASAVIAAWRKLNRPPSSLALTTRDGGFVEKPFPFSLIEARLLQHLSNEMDLFFGADFRQRLPLLALFDVIIDATYTGVVKPDARGYQACAAALGVDIGRCLMVDDQPRNVMGARQAGVQALHFDVLRPADAWHGVLQRLV